MRIERPVSGRAFSTDERSEQQTALSRSDRLVGPHPTDERVKPVGPAALGHDAVVGRAGDVSSEHDLFSTDQPPFKGVGVIARYEAHVDDRPHVTANRLGIDGGGVSGDDPLVFEAPDPVGDRAGREKDLVGELPP